MPSYICIAVQTKHLSVGFLFNGVLCFCFKDPAETSTIEADSETREAESVPINYKPSPLQVKIGELAFYHSTDM